MAITLNGQIQNSPAEGPTDSQLLAQLSQGDTASFEVLFKRHYQRIYGLVFRLVGNRGEAEDIVQEVFLQLHQRPPGSRHSHEHTEHNVSAWLYRVATNTAYNAIRSRNRLWQRNQHLVPDEKDGSAGPEKSAEQREDAERVRQALGQMAPVQGQILLLRQLGLSYAELAEVCDINPNSVGKTLSRAAETFRHIYQGLDESQ